MLSKLIAQGPTRPLLEAWTTAVGAQGLPEYEFMRKIGLVYQLPLEAFDEHSRIDPDKVNSDINLRWRNPVQRVLGATFGMLGQNTANAVGLLTDGVMISLESCSDALDRHRPQPSADKSDLDSLRESVNALSEDVKASDVDDELREFLGRLVGTMLTAIDDYPLRGAAGLRDALEHVTGALTVRRDLTEKTAKEQPKIWERIDSALGRLASICIIVTTGFQLPGMVTQAIEGPSQSAPAVVVVQQSERPSDGPTKAATRAETGPTPASQPAAEAHDHPDSPKE